MRISDVRHSLLPFKSCGPDRVSSAILAYQARQAFAAGRFRGSHDRPRFEEAGVRGKIGAKSVGLFKYNKLLDEHGIEVSCEVSQPGVGRRITSGQAAQASRPCCSNHRHVARSAAGGADTLSALSAWSINPHLPAPGAPTHCTHRCSMHGPEKRSRFSIGTPWTAMPSNSASVTGTAGLR
jgi:hypothetical protein